MVDYASGRELLDGGDPYELTRSLVDEHVPAERGAFLHPRQRNPHTPVHVVVLAPVAALPYTAARIGLMLVSAALISWSVRTVGRALGWDRLWATVAGAGAVATPLVGVDLRYGQVNALLLALIVAMWLAFRSGHDRAVGLAFGLAVAFRAFPLFLAIPLLRARRFRALGWGAAVAATATAVAGAVVGLDGLRTFMSVAGSENLGIWVNRAENFSGSAIFSKISTGFDPVRSLWVQTPASIVSMGLMALVIGVVAWRLQANTEDRVLAALPWMLLASPLAWGHYSIMLIPLVMVALTVRPLDRVMVLVGAVLFFRMDRAGAWLDGLGVPVSDTAQLAIMSAVVMSGWLVLGLTPWRRSAALRGP